MLVQLLHLLRGGVPSPLTSGNWAVEMAPQGNDLFLVRFAITF